MIKVEKKFLLFSVLLGAAIAWIISDVFEFSVIGALLILGSFFYYTEKNEKQPEPVAIYFGLGALTSGLSAVVMELILLLWNTS